MNDGLLRERFNELRNEERSGVPRYRRPAPRRTHIAWRVAAVMLIIVVIAVVLWPRPVRFTASDRMAARSIAQWQAPTDFLLRTPGSEILKGIPQ